jgi:hypothetical protein
MKDGFKHMHVEFELFIKYRLVIWFVRPSPDTQIPADGESLRKAGDKYHLLTVDRSKEL